MAGHFAPFTEEARSRRSRDVLEAQELIDRGMSAEAVAADLGRSVAAMEVACRREGRQDLARYFDRARRRTTEESRRRGCA